MTDRLPPAPGPVAIRIDWRIPAAVAAVLALLFTLQTYFSPTSNQSFAVALGFQAIVWGTWLALSPLVFAAARGWRRDPRLTAAIVARQFAIGVLVASLHAAVIGTVRWALGVTVAGNPGAGLVSSTIAGVGLDLLRYWLIACAYHAVAYHHEVRHRDVHAARLEGSLVQARLDSLQGRLHPHFLFNTLTSIGALIRDDPEGAEHMLSNLSELLRASLNAEPFREVTLQHELDLLRQYVSIQQIRFPDRLTVVIEVPAEVLDAYVPHLVLQPLAENAIRHGIAPRAEPGRLRIWADRTDSRLRLAVQDDGAGWSGQPAVPKARSGFGLAGTRARLEYLYGADAALHITDAEPGVLAVLDLPYHTLPIAPVDLRQ